MVCRLAPLPPPPGIEFGSPQTPQFVRGLWTRHSSRVPTEHHVEAVPVHRRVAVPGSRFRRRGIDRILIPVPVLGQVQQSHLVRRVLGSARPHLRPGSCSSTRVPPTPRPLQRNPRPRPRAQSPSDTSVPARSPRPSASRSPPRGSSSRRTSRTRVSPVSLDSVPPTTSSLPSPSVAYPEQKISYRSVGTLYITPTLSVALSGDHSRAWSFLCQWITHDVSLAPRTSATCVPPPLASLLFTSSESHRAESTHDHRPVTLRLSTTASARGDISPTPEQDQACDEVR